MRLLAAALCGIASLPAAFLPSGDHVLAEVGIAGAPLGLELETKAGRPFDAAALRRDVRALWATERYSDIQVSFNESRDGVYFHLEPLPRYRLRSILFEPRSEARQLNVGEDAEVDQSVARRMALELRQDLESRGFRHARVEADLLPIDAQSADVRLRVDSGEKIRVAKVHLDGPLAKEVQALDPITLFPGVRLSKAYSDDRLGEDLRRIRTALLVSGHFDAQARPVLGPVEDNRMDVSFDVDAGPSYKLEHASLMNLEGGRVDLESGGGLEVFCPALLEERDAAERAGRLDFAADIEIRPLPPTRDRRHRALATAAVRVGEPFRVRWIDIQGAPSFHDKTLRKALKLDEGDLLDLGLLRQSLARLSQFSSLQPVSERNVTVTEVAPGVADLSIRLEQQGARRWSISGPLGPMSLFGAVNGTLETRLPPWGRGLLQLSTYTVGGWLANTMEAVVEADGWVWKRIWQPSLVLSRPAMPGHLWTSGYLWSPQLTLKETLAANAAMRLRSHLGTLLDGAPPAPPLRVAVRHVERGALGELNCEEDRSWTSYLRTTARLAFAVAGL